VRPKAWEGLQFESIHHDRQTIGPWVVEVNTWRELSGAYLLSTAVMRTGAEPGARVGAPATEVLFDVTPEAATYAAVRWAQGAFKNARDLLAHAAQRPKAAE
jgi:hypothetical protein